MLEAVMFGHSQFQPVIQAIVDLAEECAKEPWALPAEDPQKDKLVVRLKELASEELSAAYRIKDKVLRNEKVSINKDQTIEALVEEDFPEALAVKEFKELAKNICEK